MDFNGIAGSSCISRTESVISRRCNPVATLLSLVAKASQEKERQLIFAA